MYDTWISIVRKAISCLDFDKSIPSWICLPCSGGYYDQDNFLMTVWEEIRSKVIFFKHDDNFQNSIKARSINGNSKT